MGIAGAGNSGTVLTAAAILLLALIPFVALISLLYLVAREKILGGKGAG